jgi:pyruvate formate lyase activating enzyme
MKEARLYEKLDKERVRCILCSHYCVIAPGKLGVCNVRQNVDGKLYTLVYDRTISQNIDPVEKKPLYHFYPGSKSYSIATPGCNFRCRWCQNWEISQMPREKHFIAGQEAPPEHIVAKAQRSGCRSIAYTYTEPTIFFEYAFDTAHLAHEAGIANIFVTNGYMTADMLKLLQPYLDGANVDLKAFRKKTYQRLVGAGLEPVLESLKTMKALGIWLEVTTLVIPGVNDETDELRDIAQFISQELGLETPWHISRFHPGYKMADYSPTPVKTLQKAQEIGHEEGLRYVYQGNVAGESNTYCHICGQLLIQRRGYWIIADNIRDSRCLSCGEQVAGIGMGWRFSE